MNDNVLVSFKWTREELEDYIRSRGGEPDDNTVEDLAGKIRKRMDGILDELTPDIRMRPAMEPYASLCKLGVTLPLCSNCERCRNGSCCRYMEQTGRTDWWETAINCEDYLSTHPWGAPRRKLRYMDNETGRVQEFPFEIISLESGDRFPDALQVIEAFRRVPEWSAKIDKVWSDVDDKEAPEKWELHQ